LGKACIYDLPIGYYPAWEATQTALARRYADWLPPGGLPSSRWARPDQKRQEMDRASVVLAASTFVRTTVERFADKTVALAPYGVDSDFWHPPATARSGSGPLRFIHVGQCSLRKGIPLLLQAWRMAALEDAELELVGSWHLASGKAGDLPPRVRLAGSMSSVELRARYHAADAFVFPSFFEGFGLVLLEAMACGLPAIATDATAAPDVLDDSCGRVIAAGSTEALVESLRWFSANRHCLPQMARAARTKAATCTWERYRRHVTAAVAPFN
jgi:glycosyltransferase involved in cell wall biosynthesis